MRREILSSLQQRLSKEVESSLSTKFIRCMGCNCDKKRYANLLKQRINAKFKERIIILSPQNCSEPEYIASRVSKKIVYTIVKTPFRQLPPI